MRASLSECEAARPAAGGFWPRRVTLIELPETALAPRLARQGVRRALGSWQPAQLTDTAELVVSELVTNSVKFAGQPAGGRERSGITVELSAVPGLLVLEVSDRDRSPLVFRDAGPDDDGGRGLQIVATLCADLSCFCVTGRQGRKTVRCVIRA